MSEYVRRVDRLPLGPAPPLGHLDIELTERCNNDCIHCCINLAPDDAGARAREMTTGQVEGILRQAADLGCLQVRFTGGEPLLRLDFEELYLSARRLGLKVLLLTNARRITPRLAGVFARVPPLAPIEVTVYGMRPESYEAVSRVRGSFAEFRRGIDLLLEHRVPFTVKGALLPPNRREIDGFEAWALRIPGMHRPPGLSMFFDLRSRRDDPVKNDLIRQLRVSPKDGIAVLARHEETYRAEMAVFRSRFAGPSGDRLFVCGAGHGMAVDAYGRAQPCLGVRTPELTLDALACSLAEALDAFRGLRGLRAKNPDYLRRCALCVLKGFCEQCPAKSWAEHGTLDTPVEYLCEVAHAQARFLGWLGPGEQGWERDSVSNAIQGKASERSGLGR